MLFIGVDLAWGNRRPTGIAVLDARGTLLHVEAVVTDEEVVAALKPYLDDDCLVAFDAPLIVTNPRGTRPGEAALNADFARFDAGAHPANTGKPEFSPSPRAARLCERLGLDMDPASTAGRRAIEVYPHPATISLFRLGRTLKYKNKPGRDLALLRAELTRLIGLLEGLAEARPALRLTGRRSPWPALVEAVAEARTKAALRVVEDQVDAVVCAYIALFATRKPKLTTTYGDFETGYIVVPTLPADLVPVPRGTEIPVDDDAPDQRDLDEAAAPDAVREYAARQPQLRSLGETFVGLITGVLDEAGFNYLSVTGRTKSVASFAAKAARLGPDGELLYPEPLTGITDQLGVRVITYVLGDVAAVAALLGSQLTVLDDRDLGQETASEGRFGYASRHLLVSLDAAQAAELGRDELAGVKVSVQVRTVLQHAWAEFEHDVRYKGTVPAEHAREFDRRFTLAAGLLELADREFSQIRNRLRSGPTEQVDDEDDDPRIDDRELAAFLAGQYPEADWSRTDHYSWISGLLLELGITSLSQLSDVLRPVNELDLDERMGYRYPPGAVRRLDDALLAAFGETYVGLRGNAHRIESLRTRLHRLLPDA